MQSIGKKCLLYTFNTNWHLNRKSDLNVSPHEQINNLRLFCAEKCYAVFDKNYFNGVFSLQLPMRVKNIFINLHINRKVISSPDGLVDPPLPHQINRRLGHEEERRQEDDWKDQAKQYEHRVGHERPGDEGQQNSDVDGEDQQTTERTPDLLAGDLAGVDGREEHAHGAAHAPDEARDVQVIVARGEDRDQPGGDYRQAGHVAKALPAEFLDEAAREGNGAEATDAEETAKPGGALLAHGHVAHRTRRTAQLRN